MSGISPARDSSGSSSIFAGWMNVWCEQGGKYPVPGSVHIDRDDTFPFHVPAVKTKDRNPSLPEKIADELGEEAGIFFW